MKGFRWKTYTITSPKLQKESGPVRFCFLSDLHGSSFGADNEQLLEAIEDHRPDGILLGGDMMVSKSPVDFQVPLRLIRKLAGRYPVWYALGNHEYRLQVNPGAYTGDAYAPYEAALREAGVTFLHNTCVHTRIRGSSFAIYGLELPPVYFKKPRAPRLSLAHMRELLGEEGPEQEAYSVLLAHNPRHGDTYFDWGADLTLCGHYHGGMVRFGEHNGLAAPQDLLFPAYCCGDFYRGEQAMAVSAGLGDHTLPLRIHNPREVLELVLCGESVKKTSLAKSEKAQ